MLLLKLLWLALVILIIHRLFRMVWGTSRNSPFRHKEPVNVKRFDATGQDVEDGEFKELK